MQLTDDLIQALDEALESTRASEIPGAASAILSPVGNWFGASGVSNIANNTPLQSDDRFEAGSITKTFIATTILQLVEEGQLSLDDTLTQWLPAAITDLTPNADQITIKQILGHTSGIADYVSVLGGQARTNPALFLQAWRPEQLVGFIDGVPPFFAPGESWRYSNTNFILAGLVIEAVTGNNYASEIRDRILTPLNLQNTFIAGEEEIPGGYIKGYWDFDSNGSLDDLSITNLSWTGSAGSLISNTADLAAFFDGLFKGNLLQSETLALMLDTIPVDSPNYDSYGLGIGALESPTGFWYIHRGQTLGFRSNLWYSPAEDITYVELINGRSDDNLVGDLLPTFRNGFNTGETPTVAPLVSLHTGPNSLIESNGTVSAHVFNVTGQSLSDEGLVVSVKAPSLSEFDLSQIEVIDGEIMAVRDDGFDLRLTDFTTLINLPIASDGVTEGLEAAVFTLEAGNGYAINPYYSVGRFNLADTTADAPASPDEPNDTIPLAIDTGLTADNSKVILSGSLDFDIGNRYTNKDGSFIYIDATEDVDFYKVSLSKGDIVAFDLEAVVKSNPAIPDLVRDRTQASAIFRLFDAEGNELVTRDLGQGPGELFATSTDPYLEFQAPVDGDYYLGVSVFTNGTPYRFGGDQFGDPLQYLERSYDPFVPDSGDGDARGGLDFRGIGGYDLEIILNPDKPVMLADQRDRSNSRPPDTVDLAAPGEPVVSLDFLTATYDPDDNLIDNNLVEGLENQGSILTLIIETEGEIPPEGILVTINSDTYLRDYYTVRTLVSAPFSPGADLIDVVTDDTGRETGVQLRVFSPKTFLPLNARTQLRGEVLELETNGPETATFFLEGGDGYGVSETKNQITATFYDTPEQAPAPSVIPEVSLAMSETTLIESESSETTLTFTLDKAPPIEGVVVYVKADAPVLSRFDVLNTEISGGAFPFPNGNFDGFYFKITEQTASITLSASENLSEEGLQSYRFALQDAPFYTIDSDANTVSFTIADAPTSLPIVSLSAEPTVLIETANTLSIHTFTLSVPPPEGGVTVLVESPNLGEFDLDVVTTTGGEITAVTETGFSFKMTEITAAIALSVADDGEAEGVETATFSLVESTDYLIVPGEDAVPFTVVDNPEQIPAPAEETGPNEIIPDAIFLNLAPDNPTATIRGGLSPREAGVDRADYRDFSEDVDFYSFEALAGSKVIIDVDAIAFETARFPDVEQRLDSELRLFDSQGSELARVNNAAAPDEDLGRDPYLEFVVPKDGQYYIGLSQLGNRDYDPFVERSGSGWIFPEIGVFSGDYDLTVSIAPAKNIAVFDFEWTGQIAGFGVEGEFSYDAGQTYTDGIVREEDLITFDISFFDPAGNLLRTYEDNHLTFSKFNFAFDANTQQILTDGVFTGPNGLNVGEKIAVGDGFTGLNLWSKSKETSSSLIHVDDWSDEFGFPLGYSSHEDMAFLTLTTAELIETGKVNETYLNDIQDSLDEIGQPIQIFEDGAIRFDLIGADTAETLLGNDRSDGINGQGGDDTIAGGLGDDVILGGDGEDVLRGDLNLRNPQNGEAGGNDILFGGEGSDRIGGKAGNDILRGDAGDDQIWGDDGDDILIGGSGNDILVGDNSSNGSGNDLFIFGNGDGTDVILDFEVGIDRIGLVEGELAFADLSLTQAGSDTLLGITSSSETLAVLKTVQASRLDEDSFAIVADMSNLNNVTSRTTPFS